MTTINNKKQESELKQEAIRALFEWLHCRRHGTSGVQDLQIETLVEKVIKYLEYEIEDNEMGECEQ